MPEPSDAYSEEGQVIVLEDGGDVGEPAGAPEDAALINDTIAFINHAVSSKALETALLVGNYILPEKSAGSGAAAAERPLSLRSVPLLPGPGPPFWNGAFPAISRTAAGQNHPGYRPAA